MTFPRLTYVLDRDSVADSLSKTEFLVVGSRRQPKWALFECPCGAGHRIEVTLQKVMRPHWTLSTPGGRPSLTPSIHLHGDHTCHFVLRRGTIRWVGDAKRN